MQMTILEHMGLAHVSIATRIFKVGLFEANNISINISLFLKTENAKMK
jgi:hypothetical protein